MPARGEAARQRGRGLLPVQHRLGLRPEDRQRHRRVAGLVAERALLRLHRLQVRFLGVDLVLDAQQFAD